MKRLPRRFFARPCLAVAEELLGMYLCVRKGRAVHAGRIVETEAYIGAEDQACHARFGPHGRSRPLWGHPGTAYVYLIYGMYDCFNVVVEPPGHAAAILVRAIEPAEGLPHGARTDGPGKLTRALGITRADNEADLCARDARLWLEDRARPPARIVTTPRIGVDYAGEWAARPWRFVDADSHHLSRRLPRVRA